MYCTRSSYIKELTISISSQNSSTSIIRSTIILSSSYKSNTILT